MAIWGPVQTSCLCHASWFSVEPIFGGAYYWKQFCVSKLVGLETKNSLKHYKNSLKQLPLTVHGLIFRRAYYRKDFCVWDLGGLIFGRAYFLFTFFWGGGLLSEFYGMYFGWIVFPWVELLCGFRKSWFWHHSSTTSESQSCFCHATLKSNCN